MYYHHTILTFSNDLVILYFPALLNDFVRPLHFLDLNEPITLRANTIAHQKKLYITLGQILATMTFQEGPPINIFPKGIVDYLVADNILQIDINPQDCIDGHVRHGLETVLKLNKYSDYIENITNITENKINQVKTNLKQIEFLEHGWPFCYPGNTAVHHHHHQHFDYAACNVNI